MNYLLDTNIIIIYSRDNEVSQAIEDRYQLFTGDNKLAISVISLGELDALEKKLRLGEKRKNKIAEIIDGLTITGINYKEIISVYGDIDAYSQSAYQDGKAKFSSRNMGKNDIWLAATASVYDLTLITTDKDFHHLKDNFIDLIYIDLQEVKKSID